MNIDDQKNFLDSILNINKYRASKRDYNMVDIAKGISETYNDQSLNDGASIYMDKDSNLNIDLVFEHCEQLGLEPIDLVAYLCDNLSEQKNPHLDFLYSSNCFLTF